MKVVKARGGRGGGFEHCLYFILGVQTGELEFAAMQHRGWRGFELDWTVVLGEGVVQFWLKPGEAAVTLGPGEEREVERIPEQLRRFL